ncbi:MAG: type II toxin-antitoxin system HicB family antitoxin [Candidatus Binataceae bacterium]
MFEYPVKLTHSRTTGEKGYTLTFPDVPEAITEGDTAAEALANAVDALETALSFYVEEGKDLPRPSVIRGRRTIRPRLIGMLKLAIYTEMRAKKIRKVDLRKRVGSTNAGIDRLLDLTHDSRLDQLEIALRAMGKDVDLHLRGHGEHRAA